MSAGDRMAPCASTYITQCTLVSPHEGACIYGKPGEPMQRVRAVAETAGYAGTAVQAQHGSQAVVWRCKHIHETQAGALACAVEWSRRCPQCDGCLDDSGRCQGTQIAGPCGFLLSRDMPDPEADVMADLPVIRQDLVNTMNRLLDTWKTEDYPRTCREQLADVMRNCGILAA